jgi:hypothetical protein
MIEITKTIEAPWTGSMRQKLIAFWSTRRFRFGEASDMSLSAERGHLAWNLISYDMTKLRAHLNIGPTESNRILVRLRVQTSFQQITEWNRAFWDLEMETCESYCLRGDLREADWQSFLKASRRAALLWTFTGGFMGQKVPKGGRSTGP